MKLPRRKFLHLATGAAALPVVSRVARAQAYPSRPVRFIVGFPPGGAPDISARLIGQWLSERLGQPFVIENRPGAGSNIATESVVHAAPDGYSLLLVGTPNAINATLYANLKFNFIRDIVPITSIARQPQVVVVNQSAPTKTVPELIAHAKANPGKLNYAAGGIGIPGHVAGELFKMMAGIDMVYVPYRGVALALTDLMGGQIQVHVGSTSASLQHIKAGKLQPLAVTTEKRLDVLPDVPALSEYLPGYEAVGWLGVGAPKNTPIDIVAKLNGEINVALADPEIRARFADLGSTVFAGSPADFSKLIVDETEKWGKVIRAANIKAQ